MNITHGVDKVVKPVEGFAFNGFDTTKNDMFLLSRSAPTPGEKAVVESIPFMNGVHDFSMMLGERVFDNRPITYTFTMSEREYRRRKVIQTKLENALMGSGVQQLQDTHDPDYYYLGKCVSVDTEDDHVYGRLNITVEFDCYPFKISKLPEGNDVWDTFNFELDVAQPVSFNPRRTTFRRLSIGEQATVGAWSTQFDGGGAIERKLLGETHIISDIRQTMQGVSTWAYYLTPLNQWVIEQDVVQAQEGVVEATVINPGSTSITPTVEVTGGIGVTVIKGGVVYNVWNGQTKDDLFRFEPGDNELSITANNATVSFNFHKELI